MPRGAAAGVAAFALTAALACENGGFDATTWNLALVAVCTLGLALLILGGASFPSRGAALLLGALATLTAWTALSYYWSASPPLAPVEAQRVALYFAVALVLVLAAKHVEPRAVAAGVAAAATFVAVWNLVVRSRGVAAPQVSGALAAPVGYANSLALLCVLGLVLLLALPRVALLASPVLVADLVLQHSTGSYVALALSVAAYAALTRPRLRAALAVLALACVVLAGISLRGSERERYWRVAVAEAQAHPVAGSGAGTFADWWLRERRVPVSTLEAHSFYLETLAELGPLGLALALAVVAVPGAVAVRSGQPALAAAVAAYAVGAAVDFHWELAGVTAPAVLVAATAVARGGTRRPSLLGAPLLVALIAAGVLAYAGNDRLSSAQSALQNHNAAAAVAGARGALRFAPYSAAAWELIGDAEQSAAAYRRAAALDPNAWTAWAKLAQVTHGESRRLALREAARLNPLASGP
jgi:O-antigen ligase/polysaccharide polymerase Wzy-like membrane protein